MSVALLTSLVLALAFTPVLAEKFVRAQPKNKTGSSDEEEHHGRFLGAIIRRYESILSAALSNRWIVLVTIVVVLGGTYILYRSLGSEFLPVFDECWFEMEFLKEEGFDFPWSGRKSDLLNSRLGPLRSAIGFDKTDWSQRSRL